MKTLPGQREAHILRHIIEILIRSNTCYWRFSCVIPTQCEEGKTVSSKAYRWKKIKVDEMHEIFPGDLKWSTYRRPSFSFNRDQVAKLVRSYVIEKRCQSPKKYIPLNSQSESNPVNLIWHHFYVEASSFRSLSGSDRGLSSVDIPYFPASLRLACFFLYRITITKGWIINVTNSYTSPSSHGIKSTGKK